ncbi:MAG: AAA-like domain-containing protein [Cyanobacteria bacterium J06648_16]
MPQKQSRRKRGVFLSPLGWQRLQSAERQAEIQDNQGNPYTLESLSTRTSLSPNTITKVRRRQAAVDRQTLEIYFGAFQLRLKPEDYQNIDAVRELPSTGDNLPGQTVLGSPFYIERPRLEQICREALQQPGSLLHIRGTRQIGKTLLMAKTAAQQRTDTVILNLKLADSNLLQDLGQFLRWFCSAVTHSLGRTDDEHWQPLLGESFNCTAYFQALLSDLTGPLILALDDVDVLLRAPAIATDFFNLIRAWHELAHYGDDRSHVWQRLRLLIVHTNEVYLSDWETPLPLGLGTVVDVPNFSQTQTVDLTHRYGLDRPEAVAEKLTHFLNGKPNLTQLALHHLQTHQLAIDTLTSSYLSPDSIFAEHLLYYLSRLQQHPDLLDSFQQVVQADQPVILPPLQAYKLSRLGLIMGQGQMALPQCHLYRVYFSHVLYS